MCAKQNLKMAGILHIKIYFLEPDQKLSYLIDLDVKSYILHYVDYIFSKWPPFPVINSLLRVKSP